MTVIERATEIASMTKHEPIEVATISALFIVIRYTFGSFIVVDDEVAMVNIEGHDVLTTDSVLSAVRYFNERA